jgi:hypothetical protein
MSLRPRAATTCNAYRQRKNVNTPSDKYSDDYLRALEVRISTFDCSFPCIYLVQLIDRSQRQFLHSAPLREHLSNAPASKEQPKKRRSFGRISSKLSQTGQQAMLKTYEDTLVTHLSTMYASQRITTVLPRSRTKLNTRYPIPAIAKAQGLIDDIAERGAEKDQILFNYVHWQECLTHK